MPELPEVECLVRHLNRHLPAEALRKISITSPRHLRREEGKPEKWGSDLRGCRLDRFSRRGKFWIMFWKPGSGRGNHPDPQPVVGHLGMTGRLFFHRERSGSPTDGAVFKHTAAIFDFGSSRLVFTDPRRFGMLTRNADVLKSLGPDPMDADWCSMTWPDRITGSSRAIKVTLMDQSAVAGLGNIYASEVLHQAMIHPAAACKNLTPDDWHRLHHCIPDVIQKAVGIGDSLSLDFSGLSSVDRLFYYGTREGSSDDGEVFRVYDREGEPCPGCGAPIQRMIQAQRSTFFCPACQPLP